MNAVIKEAVSWAVGIAQDDSHGYSQINRWGPDYDCSSLVISAYEQAGVPVKEAGATYTGNMRAAFQKCGFKSIKYGSGAVLMKGDVLLNEKHHAAMYIGDGQIVQASIAETGKIYGKEGDQTKREIAVSTFYEFSKGWDYVLRYKESEVAKTMVNVALPMLRKGDKNDSVWALQTLLTGQGYSLGTVDSDFGPKTELAVKNFQKRQQIEVDGIVGTDTWSRLLR